MRLDSIASLVAATAALALAGCGGDPSANTTPDTGAGTLEGDAALIALAQKISDTMGGCAKPADAAVESKVVGLENGAIVMLGCSKGAYSSTHRLFAARGPDELEPLSIPDYDMGGWFATNQASMAELDAGNATLTTFRKGADDGRCGSEGSYQWDGKRFVLQELRWQDCSAGDREAPPFPVMWPTQVGAVVDPNGATPEP